MISKEVKEDVYRYAVKNAFLHNGKADVGAVVGKIAALHKDTNLKRIMQEIIGIVKGVNEKPFPEIEEEYRKFEPTYELKPQQEKEGLDKLEWKETSEVVTRFAPNPNGPFHLGNARAAILSHEYAAKFNGRFLLRFDDTDPKVKKPMENAEQVFKEDLGWLGCKIDETYFASDRLDIYYKYMRLVVLKGKAYVCTCNSEEWRKLIWDKQACPCRDKNEDEQVLLLDKMLRHELKEGEAVLRIKTNLEDPDPSVRDWWAAKIVDNVEHPNKSTLDKHLWPSYNFASAIDDHELGVTLICRGQEHAQNETKQRFLYDYFGWVYPKTIHFGRIKLGELTLSTSAIKKGIEEGLFFGWDDPRLGTIRAFRRRGFQAEALKNIILEVGTNTSDATIEFNKLADFNREIVKDIAMTSEFIEDPVKLSVHLTPEMEVHGVFLNKGLQEFLVAKKEMDKRKLGDIIRLKEAYNIRIIEKNEFEVQAEFVGMTKIDKAVVAWVIEGEDAEITMDDASKRYGLIEAGIELKVDKITYLERLGYCRVDSIDELPVKLWFAHR